MYFIDSHCHLPPVEQKERLEEVINNAIAAGVHKFVNIGTSVSENAKVLKVSGEYPQTYPTAAIYPHENMDRSLDELEQYLRDFVSENREALVGVGEAGIDISNWKKGRDLKDQVDLFEFQVRLAKEYNLPLIVHNRNGDDQVLSVLNKIKPPKVVIHCFASDWKFAEKVLEMGFYISFSGLITYESRKSLLEVVKKVPNDKFLIETDSPYLPPASHRGEKNQPKYVKIIAQKISEVKGISLENVAKLSSSNTERLLGI